MAKGHRSQIKKERNAQKDSRPKARVTFVRLSSTKANIVLDQIKGKDVNTALAILAYTPRWGARVIEKVLKSAIANANTIWEWIQQHYMLTKHFQQKDQLLKEFVHLLKVVHIKFKNKLATLQWY